MRFVRAVASAGVALGVLFAAPADAQIFLRTGVDATNTPLADMSLDPFWSISLNGGSTFAAARVIPPSVICCGMATVGPTAKWISDQSVSPSSPNTGWGINSLVVARRSFDLTGYDISTVIMGGLWRVADWRYGVYLNGSLVSPLTADQNAGWNNDQPFVANSSFFTTGVNTIELRGHSSNSQYDGFWLDATVAGNRLVVTPEPASLALFATGLFALGLVRRRRS